MIMDNFVKNGDFQFQVCQITSIRKNTRKKIISSGKKEERKSNKSQENTYKQIHIYDTANQIMVKGNVSINGRSQTCI